MESPQVVKPGGKVQEVQVPCPDCENRNRQARRRCKRMGGMCKGTGLVTKRCPSRRRRRRLPRRQG